MNFALREVPLPIWFRPAAPMTDDELLRFCAVNETLRVEREPNGELIVKTPAGNRTGRRNTEIIAALHNWARKDGQGYAFDCNTGFTLRDGSMRSPDAAWVRALRWDALSEYDKDRYSPICPEFVVELRSASDEVPELEAKMEQWMANGAELAWLIDPQLKRVTIYRAGRPSEQLDEPDVVAGDGSVAGFELAMARIWK